MSRRDYDVHYRDLSICLAILLAGCSPPEKPPAGKITPLAELPPQLRRAFEPGDGFDPVPEPAFGDWLQQHPEKGQTFEEFVRSNPLRPDGKRNKIYLQPLGDFGEDAPPLAQLERFAEAFFSLEAEVLPVARLEEGPPVRWRLEVWERKQRQYLTGDIIARLGKQIPKDAYALLGVTLEDLYPKPEWNFVFGQARCATGSASTASPATIRLSMASRGRRIGAGLSCGGAAGCSRTRPATCSASATARRSTA